MALYLMLRKRRTSRNEREAETPESSGQLRTPRASIGEPALEIASNSIVGPFRELPDSGKAELRNFQTPSAPETGVPGVTDSDPMTVQEMRTQRSSQEMLTLFINQPKPCKALTTTRLPQQSRIRIHSIDDISLIATITSTSTQQSIVRSSIDCERVKTQIYASYFRKPLDLNRTLPPTPISESSMHSPSMPSPKIQDPSHPRSEGTNATLWPPLSRLVSPQSIVSKYSRDYRGNGGYYRRSP